jgi:hypothetical protein
MMVGRPRHSTGVPASRSWLPLLVCLLAVSCSGPPAGREPAPAPGEWRPFEGTWSATGTRQTLHEKSDHQPSIFSLSGSLILTGQRGIGVGFRAEVIGLSEGAAGGTARAVWTDERGDQVFSTLHGSADGSGVELRGTILGGTGRYAGVTGEYELRWRWMVQTEDGRISGRTERFKGRAKLPAATAAVGR